MDKFEINIGIFGSVSVGKSTFLNAIAGKQYSDAEIKKTTMVPQVYSETEENPHDAQTIRKNNRLANEAVTKEIDLNQFTTMRCQPIYHNIDRICDLFDPEIIDSRLKINIYDIPGLNDSASKNIYFEWVKQNIKLFDIIIFMTDITKGLNNSDETEVLHLLMDSMKKYKIKMICLMNKCDDIYYDSDQNDLVFEENEQENIYIQANNILVDIAKIYGFDSNGGFFTPFFPISSENCFIYRALIKDPNCELDQIHQNRLCKNECGSNQWKKMTSEEKDLMFKNIVSDLQQTYNNKILDTGYLAVKTIIQNTIITNKLEFIKNHIELDLKDLEVANIENISDYINLVKKYATRLSQASLLENNISYDILWQNVQKSISNYVNTVNKDSTKIIRCKDFIPFKEFELLHASMEIYCINFATFVEAIKIIPEYPEDFVMGKQKELVDKLLCIYNQLYSIETTDQMHTCPANLLHFLELIKIYAPDELDNLATNFLQIYTNPKCKHISAYPNEFVQLMDYIVKTTNKKMDYFYSIICQILINKQQYMQNKLDDENYICYIVQMKKLIVSVRDKSCDKITVFDILYEVINKNIFTCLGTNCVPNLYRKDFCHSKINNLFKLFTKDKIQFDGIDFETNLLDTVVKIKKIEL